MHVFPNPVTIIKDIQLAFEVCMYCNTTTYIISKAKYFTYIVYLCIKYVIINQMYVMNYTDNGNKYWTKAEL